MILTDRAVTNLIANCSGSLNFTRCTSILMLTLQMKIFRFPNNAFLAIL